MPDHDLNDLGVGSGHRIDSESSASSIARDFALLVEVLDEQLCLVSPSDHVIRDHLLKAKQAAERGMMLSRELIERVDSKN
jgi:hypothetical protein